MKALKIISIFEISLSATVVVGLIYIIKQAGGSLPTIEAGQFSKNLFGTDVLNASLLFIPRITDIISLFLLVAFITNLTKKSWGQLRERREEKEEEHNLGYLFGISCGLFAGLLFGLLSLVGVSFIFALLVDGLLGLIGSFSLGVLADNSKCGLGFSIAYGLVLGLLIGIIHLYSLGITVGLILGLGILLVSLIGVLINLLVNFLAYAIPRQSGLL
jgi:hypothetical protein